MWTEEGRAPGLSPGTPSRGGWWGEVDRAKGAEGTAGESEASGKPWLGNVKKTGGHTLGGGKPGSCSRRPRKGGMGNWGSRGQIARQSADTEAWRLFDGRYLRGAAMGFSFSALHVSGLSSFLSLSFSLSFLMGIKLF